MHTPKLEGFTLIEAMVAGALLAIGLAAIFQGVGSATGSIRHQKMLSQAIHVGEAVMEMNLVKNSTHAELTDGNHVGPQFDLDGRMVGAGAFTTEWDVELGTPLATMRTITVRVNWTENGDAKQLEFVTARK